MDPELYQTVISGPSKCQLEMIPGSSCAFKPNCALRAASIHSVERNHRYIHRDCFGMFNNALRAKFISSVERNHRHLMIGLTLTCLIPGSANNSHNQDRRKNNL